MTPEQVDDIFSYHTPTPEQVERLAALRAAAKTLAHKLNQVVPECADKTAAFRKLRECVMTANAAITLN